MKQAWPDVGRFGSFLRQVGAQPGHANDSAPTAGAAVANVEFQIPEMACEGCAENIDGVLHALAGVREVRPNVPKKRIRVSFESARINVQQLRNALTTAGYTALDVEGR